MAQPGGDDDDDINNKPVITTQSNPSSFRKVISSLLVSSSFLPLPTLKKTREESMAFDEAPSPAKKRKVVVVGGGIGGALLAKSLQFHSDLVLIDPKEYFEITWASLRSIVEPSVAERSVFKHSEYLTNGRLIISSAVSITDTEVLTSEGHLVPYDYLIIATGHRDNVPKTRSERLGQCLADNQKIKSANSVLVIGGGPTGVEFAAEIAVDFPDKKVTLVHNRSRLLDFVGQKASRKTLDWFSSKKVEVILDQAVKLDSYSEETKTYQTTRGETVQADCHFLCTGRPLASAWLRETILKDSLDGRGRLMVDEHLRIKGRKNIFAIGDITDIPEMKQGYLAQRHALLAAKNLKVLMAGGKESKMSAYKVGSSIAIISLGRKDAVAQFPFTTVVGCLPGYVKSKDLFVSKTRKQMGVDGHGGSGHSDGDS